MTFAQQVKNYEKKIGYKGCKNCIQQIAPLRRCEWIEKKTDHRLHLLCPRWEKKG